MFRLTVALFLAGCFVLGAWAQTAPAPEKETQSPAAGLPASGTATPAEQTSLSPFEQFKEFSALMTGGPLPGTADQIHIYRSGKLMRMEGPGQKAYQITDLDKQETHGISATGCLKYTRPYLRSFPFSYSNPAIKYERAAVGKETIDGHVCQVEDVTITIPKNATHPILRLWEAEDLHGFPIKIETRGGPMHREITYNNVVLGPQDPSLFIFPDECQGWEQTEKEMHTPKGKKPPAAKPQ